MRLALKPGNEAGLGWHWSLGMRLALEPGNEAGIGAWE